MKFAIYHPWVYVKSGLERVFLEVLTRSKHDWTWYTNFYDPDATFPELQGCQVRQITPTVLPPSSAARSLAAAAGIARTKVPPDPVDGLLLCLNGLSDLALVRAQGPKVGLCLTPIKALHDPHAFAAIKSQKPVKYAAVRVFGPPFAAIDKRLWRRMDRVVAISEETRRRIDLAGLRPDDEVEVLRPGVDIDAFSVGPAERQRQLLVAGRISWHKNIELAIDTLRLLSVDDPALSLVIAGYVDEASEGYLADLQTRAAGLPVTIVRDPSDEVLRQLYRQSEALLFTPPNEDYGLVPLEAMASGTPVISTDAGGPRETVINGETGHLVAGTAPAFAKAIADLLARPHPAKMRAAARIRAEEFDWSHFVARLDAVMVAAVGQAGETSRHP